MSSSRIEIEPVRLGAMPIAFPFVARLGIERAFESHVSSDKRDKIAVSRTLVIALYNVLLERFPLYKMGEWATKRGLVDEWPSLTDDRVGRALDRLFKCDRAALLTSVVLQAIDAFEIKTERVHNDSTTVTLTGGYDNYQNTKAAMPKRGINKDHRPDLKQLLFSLSVSDDGAVPLYFKVWDGNVTDDKTHLRNWMALRNLLGRADFTYVADSKLCTRENMEFIASEGGYFVTVLPQTRAEDSQFKDWIQNHNPDWKEALRFKSPKRYSPNIVYWTFESLFISSEGFPIVWIKSSQKEKLDSQKRKTAIDKTAQAFANISEKPSKNPKRLEAAIRQILTDYGSESFFVWQIHGYTEEKYRQEKKGRPTAQTRYRKIERQRYRFTWSHNEEKIRYAARYDGIFPLITNRMEPAKQTLITYKFQPRLEKRHEQFKTVYEVAPVFLKNPQRIEALLFLYFLALLVSSLIERQIRQQMKNKELPSIPIYPEQRACRKPTADKLFDLFRDVRLQTVKINGSKQQIQDDLTDIQKLVLTLLDIKTQQFFEARC